MLNAESVDVTVQTYRDKIKFMTNLSWQSPSVQKLQGDQVKLGIFRFLLAQFSINFKLLWEPTLKVIETFVSGSENSENLWQTWLEVFEAVNLEAAIKFGQDGTK